MSFWMATGLQLVASILFLVGLRLTIIVMMNDSSDFLPNSISGAMTLLGLWLFVLVSPNARKKD